MSELVRFELEDPDSVGWGQHGYSHKQADVTRPELRGEPQSLDPEKGRCYASIARPPPPETLADCPATSRSVFKRMWVAFACSKPAGNVEETVVLGRWWMG